MGRRRIRICPRQSVVYYDSNLESSIVPVDRSFIQNRGKSVKAPLPTKNRPQNTTIRPQNNNTIRPQNNNTIRPQNTTIRPQNTTIRPQNTTIVQNNNTINTTTTTPTQNSGSKLALLIACEYTAYEKSQKAQRLPGCHIDIKLAQKMMMEQYGYKANEFILLSDETSSLTQPTKSNILNQLDRVVTECKNKNISQLVIYYSGHGTQIRDTTGDEADGMDECLVPSDYIESGFITDDVFSERLWSKLTINTKVTCIFDCCNSGTIFDLPFIYEPPDRLVRDPKLKNDKFTRPLPLILSISGCRDPQTSASAYRLEKTIDWQGALSFVLRETLKENNYKPLKMNILLDTIRKKLAQRKFTQIPQLSVSRDVLPSTITTLF
jgi:hypothetical protein